MRLWKILILIIVLPLSYCVLFWPHYSWHQKMTIEVEKDGQIYTGSSVTSVDWYKNDAFSASHGPEWVSGVQGEAVVVELPGNQYLFALLSYSGNTEYTAHLATRILADSKKRVWGGRNFNKVLATKGEKVLTVQGKNYPLLVTFENINDPASVKEVHPLALYEAFGQGVKLKSLTLEITDEPVTRGKVQKALEWMNERNIPLNKKLPYGHPMRNLSNSFIRR